MAVDLY